MLPPEDCLRAIFAQALTGQPIALPPGATAGTLRAALQLDAGVISRIFEQEKRRAALCRRPAVTAPPPAKPRAGRRILQVAVLLCLAGGIGWAVWAARPGPEVAVLPDAKLFAAAGTDHAAFSALAARGQAGDALAAFEVGTLLDGNLQQQETVTAKSNAGAAAWYARSAAGGYAPAQTNLAYQYQTGDGVPKNLTAAAGCYGKAAAQGFANAQNALGYLYQNGLGVPQDDVRALHWFGLAAVQGLPAAQNSLAAAYEMGRGTPQDLGQAAHWFGLAAAQGEPNAQNSLGFMYYNGVGVARDFGQAAHWFAQAAAAGNAPAQVNLGLCYARGQGVKVDRVVAAAWFIRAGRNGDQDAALALKTIDPPLTKAEQAAALSAAK